MIAASEWAHMQVLGGGASTSGQGPFGHSMKAYCENGWFFLGKKWFWSLAAAMVAEKDTVLIGEDFT